MTQAQTQPSDSPIDAILPKQRRMYELGQQIVENNWEDPACASCACIILLASGAVTLLPLLEHLEAEEKVSRQSSSAVEALEAAYRAGEPPVALDATAEAIKSM